MGCAPSREDPSSQRAVVQTAKIDKQLRIDKRDADRTVKILLLGELHPPKKHIYNELT